MLRPRARFVISVPIESRGQQHALRNIEAKTVDVVDKHQQAGEILSAANNPELGGLLDGVLRVGAGISEADHFGFRRLRL